ncbi:MAG: lacA2 [Akkermansiaceae bacterium]|nr:lacA2 [Akkermansiaceae bacterium]
MRKLIKLARKRLFTWIARRSAGQGRENITANGYTKLTRKTRLGRNVHFNGMRINGDGNVVIGDNFHSGEECLFITSIHNYDTGDAIPYDDTYIHRDITIADNVWLGSRVIVLGGVSIGEGAIIQAGAVVTKSVEAFGIAGGSPAKVFKKRNEEHYLRLKSEGKFH